MGHLLPLLVLAQAAGILCADRGGIRFEAALLLGLHALLLGAIARRSARLRAASALGVAFCAGAAALGARLEAASFAPPGGVVETTVEGRVAQTVRRSDWMWVELRETRATERGAPLIPTGVRIQGPRTPTSLPALESRPVGARVRARVRLKPPRALQNPGSRDRVRSLARRGIGAVGQLVHPALHVEVATPRTPRAAGSLERLRANASQRLLEAGPGGGLLAALSLGDRFGLDRELRDTLSKLGLSHLIAVSGLHLTLIAALGYAAARCALGRIGSLARRRDTRRLSLWLAVALATGYALLSGWGVPVRRALVLLVAVAVGFLRRRSGRRGHPLALAALVVLACEPGALFEPGAQMSFAASAAILAGLGAGAARRGEAGFGARVRAYLDSLLRTSSAALAATAPLAAAHFGRVAPAGVLANLVAIPLTAALLLPASLIAALAALLAPEAGLTTRLVSASAAVASLALRGAERAAAWLPEPTPIPPPSLPALLAALALAALVTRLPATWARIALAVSCAAWLAHCPAPSIVPGPPRVVALDVGRSWG